MSATSPPSADPLPPQRPLERHAHLETDVFCGGCGYNLHGQVVTRDDRLGLMICRCPECGRYHAAGHGTAATSLWMSRLAAWLLALWVLIVLTTAVFAVIGFGALQLFPTKIFTYGKFALPDGREVANISGPQGRYVWVAIGTTQPVDQGAVRYLYVFRNAMPPSTLLLLQSFLLFLSAGIGLAAGMLLVVFLWHWPKRRYAWVAILPLVTAGFISIAYWFDPSYEFVLRWTIGQIVMWALVQTLFMVIGTRFGRPFARLLLRMFVPPKPLQHLAFMWHVDGKTPPPATHPSQV